jgi:PfaD family protein
MGPGGETKPDGGVAKTAIDGGVAALSAATTAAAMSAKSGAKLAVGTLFAGCNVLLDLGVRVARRLPLAGDAAAVQLETGGEHIAVAVRQAEPLSDGAAPIGWWSPGEEGGFRIADFGLRIEGAAGGPGAGGADDREPRPASDEVLAAALRQVTRLVCVVECNRKLAVGVGGRAVLGADTAGAGPAFPLRAIVPALRPQALGDPAFRAAHGVQYAYVAGAMANGIASEALVEAMSRGGMMGFFGAAGLSLQRIEQAIDRLQRSLGDGPFGFNLIHSPNEPDLEAATADLYLRRGVRRVSAAAYLDLTLPLVRYRVKDIHRDGDGRIVCPNRVMATVSRVEVARKFMSPPPGHLLKALVESRDITEEQAALARAVPMADDVTAEADSGGHTDNQPAVALIPTLIALRDELQAEHKFAQPVRVGAAGGVATPASAAAMFAMGAAYVVTGTINQACMEAGTSPAVREMLAQARQGDVMMAPAADMFEMGVRVQVLKWGTMFAVRARKLYDLYRAHNSLDELPLAQRTMLERDYFRGSLDQAWVETRRFFEKRDPKQIAKAEADAKHRMALVFRSYLGRASHWAIEGDSTRKADYQIWCGPAMGAFNEWVRGSFLERPERRDVVTVAMNLLLGAAVVTRANWLRAQGVPVPPQAAGHRPMELAVIAELVGA